MITLHVLCGHGYGHFGILGGSVCSHNRVQ